MGLGSRPALRWKDLIILFHLSIGLPGGRAGLSGLKHGLSRVQRMYIEIIDFVLIIKKQCYMYRQDQAAFEGFEVC